jgi:opacity protein-like surface antigen
MTKQSNTMKSKTLILLALAGVMLWPQKSKAQFGVGFNVGYVNWFENQGYTEDGQGTGFYSPKSGYSGGIEAFYMIKPKMRVNLALDVVRPVALQTTQHYYLGSPSYVYVNIGHPAYLWRADFQYDIVNDFKSNGLSLYALAGAAFNWYNYSTTYGTIIPGSGGTTYTSTAPDQIKNYNGFSGSLGLGVEYAFSYSTHVFLEARACTGDKTHFNTSNLENDNFLPNNFNPMYSKIALGMRFNFGKPTE